MVFILCFFDVFVLRLRMLRMRVLVRVSYMMIVIGWVSE